MTLLGAAALFGLPLWHSPAGAQSAQTPAASATDGFATAAPATAQEAPRTLPWPNPPSLNFYGAPRSD